MPVEVLTYGVFFLCILLLGTISGIFCERVGITNIAINGFIVFGAFIHSILSYVITNVINPGGGAPHAFSPWLHIPLSVASALITGLFALVFGFLTIKIKGNQTVAGFAMSLLVSGLAGFGILVLRLAQKTGTLTHYGTYELALNSSPANWTNIVSYKLVLVILITVVALIAINKTRWGLRFKSVGENPQAADVAGINVMKLKWQGIFFSGLIAGVAGSIYAQYSFQSFAQVVEVNGLGFMALTIMITSQWKIHYAVGISTVFAFLYSWSFYGVVRINALSHYAALFEAVPYIITLIILVSFSKKTVAPEALGIAYDKSKR